MYFIALSLSAFLEFFTARRGAPQLQDLGTSACFPLIIPANCHYRL